MTNLGFTSNHIFFIRGLLFINNNVMCFSTLHHNLQIIQTSGIFAISRI